MDPVKAIDGLALTPLKVIPGEAGSVLHAMRAAAGKPLELGEVYFSTVKQGAIKGWKKHHRMVLNIVVPCGLIRFYILDDRRHSEGLPSKPCVVDLGPGQNYQRLTVPPGVWMAFRGLASGESVLANLASIPHDPGETEARPLDDAKFQGLDFDA
jgi:dTDP-4-dehydrorhamnose 3,5-epimerase